MVDNEVEVQQTLEVSNAVGDNWREKPGTFSLVLGKSEPQGRKGTPSETRWVFEPSDGSGTIEVSPEDVPDSVRAEIDQRIKAAHNLLFTWTKEEIAKRKA